MLTMFLLIALKAFKLIFFANIFRCSSKLKSKCYVFPKGDISGHIDRITWSLILALGVCYQARLTDRREYRESVARSFRHPCRLPGGAERIEREISR